jgi:hypothetical protein
MSNNIEIQQVVRYTYKGKDYKHLSNIKTLIDNQLGAILDSVNKSLPVHKQLITEQKQAIFDVLFEDSSNRVNIVEMLSTDLLTDSDSFIDHCDNFMDYMVEGKG